MALPGGMGRGPVSPQSSTGSGPGFSGLGPVRSWKIEEWRQHNLLGLLTQLPCYHHWETVSFACWSVVWCVLCGGGQSLVLISGLCPCLYIPGAAGCFSDQGSVHTIGISRSLIRVLEVSEQTPAVLPPLDAGLWVGYNSLSLNVQLASYLSDLIELQSFSWPSLWILCKFLIAIIIMLLFLPHPLFSFPPKNCPVCCKTESRGVTQ